MRIKTITGFVKEIKELNKIIKTIDGEELEDAIARKEKLQYTIQKPLNKLKAKRLRMVKKRDNITAKIKEIKAKMDELLEKAKEGEFKATAKLLPLQSQYKKLLKDRAKIEKQIGSLSADIALADEYLIDYTPSLADETIYEKAAGESEEIDEPVKEPKSIIEKKRSQLANLDKQIVEINEKRNELIEKIQQGDSKAAINLIPLQTKWKKLISKREKIGDELIDLEADELINKSDKDLEIVINDTKTDDTKTDDAKVDDTKTDDTKADDTKADDAKTDIEDLKITCIPRYCRYIIEKNGKKSVFEMDIVDFTNKNIRELVQEQIEELEEETPGILEEIEKPQELAKKIDPYFLQVLINMKEMELCKKYLQQLSKGKEGSKDDLPFELEYDLKELKDCKEFSWKNKSILKKLAKEHKQIAEVKQDKPNMIKRIAAGFLAIGTLFGTGTLLLNKPAEEKEANNDLHVILPEDTKKPSTEIEEKVEEEVNRYESFRGEQKVNLPTEKSDEQEYNMVLGDMVEVKDGTIYYEASDKTGRKGQVGKNITAEEYMIDGVSLFDKTNGQALKIEDGTQGHYGEKDFNLDEYIETVTKMSGVSKDDIEVMVHLNASKEMGNMPIGWTDIMNTNIEKTEKEQDDKITQTETER